VAGLRNPGEKEVPKSYEFGVRSQEFGVRSYKFGVQDIGFEV